MCTCVVCFVAQASFQTSTHEGTKRCASPSLPVDFMLLLPWLCVLVMLCTCGALKCTQILIPLCQEVVKLGILFRQVYYKMLPDWADDCLPHNQTCDPDPFCRNAVAVTDVCLRVIADYILC